MCLYIRILTDIAEGLSRIPSSGSQSISKPEQIQERTCAYHVLLQQTGKQSAICQCLCFGITQDGVVLYVA